MVPLTGLCECGCRIPKLQRRMLEKWTLGLFVSGNQCVPKSVAERTLVFPNGLGNIQNEMVAARTVVVVESAHILY